jgi:hypothetical protein
MHALHNPLPAPGKNRTRLTRFPRVRARVGSKVPGGYPWQSLLMTSILNPMKHFLI